MTRYGHIVWHVIAVMAFAGTAALAVTLTRAPGGERVALSSESSLSACAAGGLRASLGLAAAGPAAAGPGRPGGPGGPGDPAGGAVYALEFTNVSPRACDLYGYPDVSAYAGSPAAGGQVGAAAVHDTSVRPRPVVLAPGATARSVLRVGSVSGLRRSGCGQVTVAELRVRLPHSGRPAFVPVRLPACSRRGHVFMSVQPIQARPGVPGHTAS
jgi:hypothetical protein